VTTLGPNDSEQAQTEPMTLEERVTELEKRQAGLEKLVSKLARGQDAHPAGRDVH
jgi:hypothetical protein